MIRNFIISIGLLLSIVLLVCGIYPLIVWCLGQTIFPFQANGSMLKDQEGKIIGSSLIAQDFQQPEHFHPRPSAAKYDAANSTSSALAPSNYKLRNRVARFLGPIVDAHDGKNVGPDIEAWFAQDKFAGKSGIVAQWVKSYPSIAQEWVNSDPANSVYIAQWAKEHPELVAKYTNKIQIFVPTIDDLTGLFFNSYSKQYPGKFPRILSTQSADGNIVVTMQPIATGAEIQATFFDMWRQEHKDMRLKYVQGDMVTTSGSGLDPHITLKNAMQQLDRVAAAWAAKLPKPTAASVGNDAKLKQEIRALVLKHASAPIAGLAGEEIINVLEVNLALHKNFDIHP